MPPDQQVAGLLHALNVKAPSEVKHVFGEEGRQNRTRVDPVFVGFSPGIFLGVKSPVFQSETHDPNISRQNRIEGSLQFAGVSPLRESEMSDLPPRVDSSIGASGPDD